MNENMSGNAGKKTIIPTVVVVVLIVAGIYLLAQPKTSVTPADQNKPSGQTYDPKNPNFVLGVVTKVSADQINFTVGPNTNSAQISAQTKFVNQVKDGATIKPVEATISDIKEKQQIVVYFSSPPKNGVYIADKVQIIGQ